jgi:hypothetical protein
MTTVSGTTLRGRNARGRPGIAAAPVLIIAGVLAALALIPWLLGASGHVGPPDIAAAPPSSPGGSAAQATSSYVARLRGDLKEDHARLVKERRAGSYESARSQRLAPGRRAPSHPDRWVAQGLATGGHAGLSIVIDAAIASEAVHRSSAAERRNDINQSSLEGDLHTPRGPPAKTFAEAS